MNGSRGEVMGSPPSGRCGRRGCGEAYFSGPSLSRRYRELSGETLSPEQIYGRYENSEPHALALFGESFRILGELFANCVNILDLEAIILGGGVSNIPLWYDHVPSHMNKAIFGIPNRQIPIMPAVLGDSAGVLGAALLTG